MSGNPRAKQFVNVNVPLPAEMRARLYARSVSQGTAKRPSITEGAELSIQAVLAENRAIYIQRPPRHTGRTNLSLDKSLLTGVKGLADRLEVKISDVVYSLLLAEAGSAPRTVFLEEHTQAQAA
jgi:hypothetical protein